VASTTARGLRSEDSSRSLFHVQGVVSDTEQWRKDKVKEEVMQIFVDNNLLFITPIYILSACYLFLVDNHPKSVI
jgi:hypothetical protein